MICRVLSCCVAATPLAPDYQRSLEAIQCVDVERLSRLPVASARHFQQLVPDERFLTLDCAICCLCCLLQSATFKVNIRFSNVASELLIWVSEAVCRERVVVVVCVVVCGVWWCGVYGVCCVE